MLTVRMTTTEKLLITGKARSAGMKTAEWLRAAAKTAVVSPKFSPEDATVLRQLTGMFNDLNLIAGLAAQEGLLSLQNNCRQTVKKINQLLSYLNSDDRKGIHQ